MPAPAHFRITFSGVIGTTTNPYEIWSNTLHASFGSLASPYAALSTLSAGLQSDWTTRMNPNVSDMAVLTRVRVAAVGADGKVVRDPNGAFIQADWAGSPSTVGSPVVRNPPQVALAVTLQSAASGVTGRGRIFLPVPAYGTLDVSGRMSTTTRDTIQGRVKLFLENVNTRLAAYSTGSRLVVASGGSITKGIEPALRPITAVGIGLVLDTQRRRRNNLQEERVMSALA